MVIRQVKRSERFLKDFNKLKPDIQKLVDDAEKRFIENPQSTKLRFKQERGYDPPVYSIHIAGNHHHKISMIVSGDTAEFLRVKTHKDMDKSAE